MRKDDPRELGTPKSWQGDIAYAARLFFKEATF